MQKLWKSVCNSENGKVRKLVCYFRKCKSYKMGKRKSYEKVCVINKLQKFEN